MYHVHKKLLKIILDFCTYKKKREKKKFKTIIVYIIEAQV